MLKEQAKILSKISIVIDIALIIAAFVLAYHLRNLGGGLAGLNDYRWVLLVIIPLWCLLMDHYGIYDSHRISPLPQIITALAKTHAIGGIITAATIYVFELRGFSRSLFGYFIVISFVLLTIKMICLKTFLNNIRKLGYNFRNILVVGTDVYAEKFIKLVELHAGWGLKIIGLVSLSDDYPPDTVGAYKILGRICELTEICKTNTTDEVVFCAPPDKLPNLEDYVLDMQDMGISTRVVLNFYDLKRSKRELSLFHGQIPILTFHYRSFDLVHLALKRGLDIVGALVGLCLSSVLFPFIALAIKLDSPGPLFFGQKRVGMSGRVFTCWKFRSMYMDAEERKKELMHLNEMQGAIFKIKNDPRITGVGGFLRKTSLDELPQFWNVLKGEMSLVGTRPPTPNEVAGYDNWHRKRIRIKPGITGMWQVSGRNQICDFDEVAKLDIEYIENWTFYLDIKILFKTLWVIFARSGS